MAFLWRDSLGGSIGSYLPVSDWAKTPTCQLSRADLDAERPKQL